MKMKREQRFVNLFARQSVWQMNLFMLREILYGETYDKSPNGYSKIRERGGGEGNLPKSIVRKSAKLRPGEAQLGSGFRSDWYLPKLYNQHGVPAEVLGCLPC
jgi:hypothetical protein